MIDDSCLTTFFGKEVANASISKYNNMNWYGYNKKRNNVNVLYIDLYESSPICPSSPNVDVDLWVHGRGRCLPFSR